MPPSPIRPMPFTNSLLHILRLCGLMDRRRRLYRRPHRWRRSRSKTHPGTVVSSGAPAKPTSTGDYVRRKLHQWRIDLNTSDYVLGNEEQYFAFEVFFFSDDTSKRKVHKSKDFKEIDKYDILVSEKSPNYKFHSLKLALLIITCCTVLSLLYSQTISNKQLLHSISRSTVVDVGWFWQRIISDTRYISNSNVDWGQISNILEQVYGKGEKFKVGLLNFNSTEISYWKQSFTQAEISVVHLDYADPSITWQILYPDLIDEEEENEVPACPSLPQPQVKKGSPFDLVAVKLPCNLSGSWSKDVARLHLQLTAAKLASASTGRLNIYVLLVTDYFPTPNLFVCKDLVRREGNAWLYKSDIRRLRDKLQLPIGSCELTIPLKADVRVYTEVGRREAYATILHSAEKYVCGAIALAHSIRLLGSRRDLLILVDESISDHHRSGLEAAGWKVRTIARIQNPKAKQNAYNKWNYSKFRIWQFTEYDKIVFVDADLLILRNIDFLFTLPELSVADNIAMGFNSGLMVVEPSNCTFQMLMDHIDEITSNNGGDQGYLNEIFTWWHRIPNHMNFLKHFLYDEAESVKAKKSSLFRADPPILYAIHYLGLKPWLCFRDYDCNWNSKIYQEFANDEAHAAWWKVHDTMPEKLQYYCLLSSYEKAHLEYNRRHAEEANFTDGHWKKNVMDPRSHICFESFCSWESILSNWGKTSWSSRRNGKDDPTLSLLTS